MSRSNTLCAALVLVLAAWTGCSSSSTSGTVDDTNGDTGVTGTTADHRAVAAYDSIPADVIERVSNLNIYYGHTSHGSQLVTGVAQMSGDYQFTDLHAVSMDLGSSPGWFNSTKSYLDGNPDTDVVVWSWCGQQSSNSDAVVQAYLSNMSALETQYPNVRFIYMTGHLRGAYSEYLYDDAENAVLQHNNQMVRDYCTAHDKWFFDFADIESYRDGSSEQCRYNGMPSECDWQSSVTGCAHSRMPNCTRKGKAFYWLLARITGWEG